MKSGILFDLGICLLALGASACSDDTPHHADAAAQIKEVLTWQNGLSARILDVTYLGGAFGESDSFTVEVLVTEQQISCAEAKDKYQAAPSRYNPDTHTLARLAAPDCDQTHSLDSDTLPVRSVGQKTQYDYSASFVKSSTGWVLQPTSMVSNRHP